jgi:hypothetical protein
MVYLLIFRKLFVNAWGVNMSKKPKTETVAFRCTTDMKKDIYSRSLELHEGPAEYIHSLIEKDLASKAGTLPEREQTFVEQQFQIFADKLLTFFSENVHKKLLKIERSSSMSNIFAHQSLTQSIQAAVRSKEVLNYAWKDEAKLRASDEKIKERAKLLEKDLTEKLDSGAY